MDSSIKYANSPVFTVRIAPEDSAHGIVVSGAIKEGVRVTDKFDLDFSPSTDYTFLGWDAVKKDDHSVSFAQNVVFSEPKSLSTSVQIVKGNDDIYKGQLQLRPLCRPIEKGIINITSTYGAVSYNSEAEYKEGTLLKLTFNPNPGYGFTHWVVMIGNSYDTTGEYVKIENSANTVTDATFLKRPENNEIIYLIPVCVERPAVISKTPQLSENGVCRDSRIKVLFDSPMNEGSIYYTKDEYAALGTGISPIPSSADPKKIYGYTKDGKKYYKNIEIKDQNSGKSLLEYFGEPKFVSSNMLIIPTNDEKVLPLYTELLVTLSSGFYTKTSDGYDVSLSGKDFWNYLVNNQTDSAAPTFSDVSVQAVDGVFKKRDGTAYAEPYNFNGSFVDIPKETNSNLPGVKTSGYKYFARNGVIKVNAEFTDIGTGPAALYMEIASGTNYTNTKTMELPIRIMGNKGIYQQPSEDGNDIEGIEIELKDENGQPISDGVYRLSFIAEDGAGKTKTYDKYFYVLIDNTNDPVDMPSSSSIAENSITISDITNASTNFYFYQLKKTGESEYSAPVRITSNSVTIDNLEPGNTYYFKYFKCDDYGNSNKFIEFKKNTKPAKPQEVLATVSQTSNRKVTLSWKKGNNPNYKGADIAVRKYDPQTGSAPIDGGQPTIQHISAVENQDEYSYDFTNLDPGYRYRFTVSSYDSGDDFTTGYNSSVVVPADNSIGIVLPPDPPTNLYIEYDYSEWNESLLLNWTKPAQGFKNAYYYSYIDTSDPSAQWSEPRLVYNPQLYYDAEKGYIHFDQLDLTNEMAGRLLKFKIWSAVVNSSDHTIKYAQSRDGQEINYFVPPLIPENFTWDSKTTTSITFKWDQVQCNYDGVKIGYKKHSNNSSISDSDDSFTWVTVTKGANRYTLESLAGGTEYDIRYGTYVNNGTTTVESGKLNIRDNTVSTKPNPITNLKAEPISGSKVKFTWTKPVGNYSKIKFYRKEINDTSYPDSDFKTISISENTEEFDWDLLSYQQKNIYDVKAIVYSADSDSSPASEEIIAYSGIDPVTNIRISNVETSQIYVSWDEPETAFDSVNVSYKPKGSNDTPITSTITPNQNIHTKIMQNLSAGTEYEITIETVVTKKNGITYTNPQKVYVYTRPKPVKSCSAFKYGRGLRVRWTPDVEPYDGFMLFINTVNNLSTATYVDTVDKTLNEYIIDNLNSGTTYYVWVITYVGPVPDISSVKQDKTYNTNKKSTYETTW